MKNLLLLLFLLAALAATAQPCSQAAQIRKDLTAYFPKQLDKALDCVKALRACDPSFDREADEWTDKIFTEIKAQKRRAEDAERRAQAEAEKARRSREEVAKTLEQLKQNTSNFWLSEAKNAFERDFSFKALGCLLKSEEAWEGNKETKKMLDSIAGYLPDWGGVSDGYVDFGDGGGHLFGYYDASTTNGLNCDYIVTNFLSGDTTVFRQVSKHSISSLTTLFSSDDSKIVYFTDLDTSCQSVRGTINIYDTTKKKHYRFPRAQFHESWFSNDNSTYVFLSCDIGDPKNEYCNKINIFDFDTEELKTFDNSRAVSGDARFYISPDGDKVAYCTTHDTGGCEIGTVNLWHLRQKTLKTFKNAFLHEMRFSADSRYIIYGTGCETPYPARLIDLETWEEMTADAVMPRDWSSSTMPKSYLLNFEERKIRIYDAAAQTWSETNMPSHFFKSDVFSYTIKGDKLVFLVSDTTKNETRVGLYDIKQGKETIFPETFSGLEQLSLFNFNKANNIMSLKVNFGKSTGVYFWNLENVTKEVEQNEYASDISQHRAQISDNGNWGFFVESRRLCLLSLRSDYSANRISDPVGGGLARSNFSAILDSGYFRIVFFTGDNARIVYVNSDYEYNRRDQYLDLTIAHLTSGEQTRLKAYRSNKLTESDDYTLTDIWVDDKKRTMLFSSGPKSFTAWDLVNNKPIRTFKIAQEYEEIELKGDPPVVQIKFRNNVYKWIKLDAPAKPLQFHIGKLR